jgi:hypothetical protein
MKTILTTLCTGAFASTLTVAAPSPPPEAAGANLLGWALPFVSAICSVSAAIIIIRNRNKPVELLQPLEIRMRADYAKTTALCAVERKIEHRIAELEGEMKAGAETTAKLVQQLNTNDERRTKELHDRINPLDRMSATQTVQLAAIIEDLRELRARINP